LHEVGLTSFPTGQGSHFLLPFLLKSFHPCPITTLMKLCGITGGIGMGKSTAACLLRRNNLPLVDTDDIGRELVQPGQPALAAIQNIFGSGVVSDDGELRRAELARIIFADTAARRKLEAILHPAIRARWLAQVEEWKKQGRAIAFVVIPLLFETSAQSYFDKTICVACSSNSQRVRLAERGWDAQEIRQRIAAQMPVEDKISRSDFLIWTEGELGNHSLQLERILARL
jgi:dephospho-CoA kinase